MQTWQKDLALWVLKSSFLYSTLPSCLKTLYHQGKYCSLSCTNQTHIIEVTGRLNSPVSKHYFSPPLTFALHEVFPVEWTQQQLWAIICHLHMTRVSSSATAVFQHVLLWSLQEQLRRLYPRLKVLAFGAKPESTLHTYLPSFLSRATPHCPDDMKREVRVFQG